MAGVKRSQQLQPTGIKVLDLLAPVGVGGRIGVFGKAGVGRIVLVEELLWHRLKESADELHVFVFVEQWDLLGTQDVLTGENELAQKIAWIPHRFGGNPFAGKDADYFDTRIYASPVYGTLGVWPALDPLHCHSTLLNKSIIGEDHFNVAMTVKDTLRQGWELLGDSVFYEFLATGARQEARDRFNTIVKEKYKAASSSEQQLIKRTSRLIHYLSQPFFVAEDFTKMKGAYVDLPKAISDSKAILNDDPLPDVKEHTIPVTWMID